MLEKYALSWSHKKSTFVSYSNTGHKILSDFGYNKKDADIEVERNRIVKAAAEFVLDFITQMNILKTDKFFAGVKNDIPDTLRSFCDTVIMKHKKVT